MGRAHPRCVQPHPYTVPDDLTLPADALPPELLDADVSDGILAPGGEATCAEAAQILINYGL